MSTSLRVIILFTTIFLLPFATSLTLPQDFSLVTPSLNIPMNTTHPHSSQPINATFPWPPSHTWPPAPNFITIPLQRPPASLHVLHFARPGYRAQTDALLCAIDTQIARYNFIIGLPGPFTIEIKSVRFSLRLVTPQAGGTWLSKELAIAALKVLGKAVEAAGATEMSLVVVSGERLKATVWVKFEHLAGA